MGNRAVTYSRVSSDDRGSDGRNLASQAEMCKQYCEQHRYEIVAELAEDDRGASGAAWDLPELNKALEMARAGEFDILVCRELDRLSRSLAKQLICEEQFQRAHVAVEFVLATYSNTPEGDLQKHLRAVIAEYEKEKITERTTRAKHNKAKSGQVVAVGRIAYGYRSAGIDGKTTLEIYEPEAQVVRRIYEAYTGEQCKGAREIARELTEMGIPSYGDVHPNKTAKIREQGYWGHSMVHGVLTNETYAGVWCFGDIQVAVPAIVSRQTWQAAQDRCSENKRKAKRNRKYNYMLSGMVVCGQCEAPMWGTTTLHDRKPYRYYACSARRGRDDYTYDCDSPPFQATSLEAAVWERVHNWLVHFRVNRTMV